MSRIRKAVVAGAGAGLAAAVAYLAKAGRVDGRVLGEAAVVFVTAGLPIGWATWVTPNAPAPRP